MAIMASPSLSLMASSSSSSPSLIASASSVMASTAVSAGSAAFFLREKLQNSIKSHHQTRTDSALQAHRSITFRPCSNLSNPKLSITHSRLTAIRLTPIVKTRVSVFSAKNPTENLISCSSDETHNPITAPLMNDSIRTVTTIFATALALGRVFSEAISMKLRSICLNPNPADMAKVQQSILGTVGPLFFAAARPRVPLNTPLTIVASGMAKWLDIYGGVLMVRVLLSWFPNIPWDRQPLSAIRDLCDPYLNLFRNIIPPLFDTLDVSPLLAFAVLGTLSGILNTSRLTYG